MNNLFLPINQSLFDGSAHAYYLFNHSWWLAHENRDAQIVLIIPKGEKQKDPFQWFGLNPLPNLKIQELFALKKKKGGFGLTLNRVYFRNVSRFLKKNLTEGDIIFTASFIKLFSYLLEIKKLRAKASYVYEVHQLELLDRANQKKIDMELQALSKADVLFTTTYQLLKVLAEHVPGISIVPLGLACNSQRLEQAPVPETDNERAFTVLYIGSLYRQQGIEWLVENWRQVRPSADSRLILVGGNKDATEKIKNMAAQRGLDTIKVCGFIPPPKLGPVLSLADVLIVPSLPEGRMPYVAITKVYDYLAMGRPILAADLPGIREVIENEKNGLLFKAGDAIDLKKKLERLASDKNLRKRLSDGAGQRLNDFSWPKRANQWWKVVNQ